MAANKTIMLGPVALPAAIGNLFAPPTTQPAGGVSTPATIAATYYIFRKVRVVNPTTGSLVFGLWKQVTIGASPVAGKEFLWGALATLLVINAGAGQVIPAGGQVEWGGQAKFDGSEADRFLVGGGATIAGVGNAGLTIEIETEVGFV